MVLQNELFYDSHPATHRETQARSNFMEARNYAISLIEIHDYLTGKTAGRPASQYEALKRSALILTVTAWESFVEETVKEQLEILLGGVGEPHADARVAKVFNFAASEWIGPPETKKPKPPETLDWTGDGWKRRILASLDRYLNTFHTPTSENTRELFERYLGLTKFPKNWHWQGVGCEAANKKLDTLIKLRGQAVHVGKRRIPVPGTPPSTIGRKVVINALNLIYCLVASTEKALAVAPSAVPTAPAS